ncbi:MAG: hypothetical protein GTN76_04875 [Candidatus Aenigmarchaeota archaeon]|nr:hypothetical protein [bacterium]NIO20079.1 hypothetical protein [Candidatus Aenigmarchaeota archaeon]
MSDRLRIMISSRCKDEIEIGNEKLSFVDLRKEIKKRLEQENFLSKKQFLEIKISEDFRTDFNYDSYEYCLQEINNADLVLVLFSGQRRYGVRLSY